MYYIVLVMYIPALPRSACLEKTTVHFQLIYVFRSRYSAMNRITLFKRNQLPYDMFRFSDYYSNFSVCLPVAFIIV